MSQSHLRLKQRGMEQNKDLNVATPEEFVRHFGGNRVINRVSTLALSSRISVYLIVFISIRFWLLIMESQLSSVCARFVDGPMKCFVTSEPYDLLLWLRPKTWKVLFSFRQISIFNSYILFDCTYFKQQTPNISKWPTTTCPSLVELIITTMRTSNSFWTSPSACRSVLSHYYMLHHFCIPVICWLGGSLGTSRVGWMGSRIWESQVARTID